jgi:hypothetical protein
MAIAVAMALRVIFFIELSLVCLDVGRHGSPVVKGFFARVVPSLVSIEIAALSVAPAGAPCKKI